MIDKVSIPSTRLRILEDIVRFAKEYVWGEIELDSIEEDMKRQYTKLSNALEELDLYDKEHQTMKEKDG